jgi:ribonuclease P protein component
MLPPEHDAGSTGSTAEPAKVGFVVSRGVGPAVVRNRVARRLRHLVGGHIAELEPGSHLVVRATPRAAAASSESLGDDLQACLGALRRRGAASPTAGSTS